jgi:adenylate cyclase
MRARLPSPEVLLAAAVLLVVALLCSTLPAWQALDRKAFDAMTVATAPGESKQPIVIVAIDEASMRAIGKQWPWPRSLHGELVQRISGAGAAAIALDLLMAEPSTPPEDDALARAIAGAGNVVMAADFVYSEQALARIWRRTEPLELFVKAGALPGLASVPFDPDTIVRRIPGEPDAFWRQVVKVMQLRAPTAEVPPLPRGNELIRYLGGNGVYDAVPYHMVLQASPEELRTVFEGRIVIVGRDLQANPEIGRAQADLFATPFLEEQGTLTSGMRLHATLVDNALSGIAVSPLPRAVSWVLELLAAVLAYFAFRRWHPVMGGFLLVAMTAAFVALAWAAFTRANAWVVVSGPIAVVLSSYLAFGGRAYLAERRRKREMQDAFGRYVSPHVVARIAADPAALGLGGERREITVMFTDLAGFTSLSEKSDAETVARILKQHFTIVTAIVLARGGTVVNFMGDGMMAFWGAPLDDPEHALHAVQAAIEMQEAMRAMESIRMRIGLNTCSAIVGNMGSESRLAYSAMGDGVNLASRLEGANKAYGTGILLAASTAERVAGKVPLLLVDRVRVSGKQEAVAVYTPMALANEADIQARLAVLRADAERVAPDGSLVLAKL